MHKAVYLFKRFRQMYLILHHIYLVAYLEISQRTKILNERVNVISDLLDMLRKDIGVSNMRRITWIIIWLIVVAVFVAIVSDYERNDLHKYFRSY